MADIQKKTEGFRTGPSIVKRKRRRKSSNVKKNIFWCGIILILTLILGAFIGLYSHFFDQYFKFEGERITVSEQDISNKLKSFNFDRLVREKERSNR